MTNYEDHKNFEIHTGTYVSTLIQNSWDAGYNNFYFETNNIDSLAAAINGYSIENPITIHIDVNNGLYVGWDAGRTTFKSLNKETLKSIAANSEYSNEFYLIKPNGEEIPYKK